MFRIAWGEGAGKFRYEESEVGFEADVYPRKYVRDQQGNFYFLEPDPPARLSKFSGEGRLLYSVELTKFLPLLTSADVVAAQELYEQSDGTVSVLLRAYLKIERREEIYLAYFDSVGKLRKLVPFPHFQLKSFRTHSASFLDKEGYLWALREGGACDVYAPTGELDRTLAISGSFVDTDGHLYCGFNPAKLYSRLGKLFGQLHYEGPASSEEPEELDGESGTGYVFSWRHLDETQQGDLYTVPRVLDFYRPDINRGKLIYSGTISLPPSKYRVPDPRSDYVERTELYENRIIFDEAGNVYFLGRSPHQCWMEKVQVQFK
jgi:hypothetical protein